jgi:hypothetical protein
MKLIRLKALVIKVAPVLVLAAVLVLTDVALNKPVTNTTSSDMLPQLPATVSNVNAATKPADILSLYSQFNAPVEASEEQAVEPAVVFSGLTPAEQQLQQGLLRALYIDDQVYRLSAIVNQGQPVASLRVTDATAADKPAVRLTLKQGDTLHQYDVISVTSRRITLRHQQRELWLQLFTPGQAEAEANEAVLPVY